MLDTTAVHNVTISTKTRQLGRTVVTDHMWSCSCGVDGTAPNGFRHQREAWINSLAHRQR
jgi:hypothetical protein